ncbi:MAG: hypothetical protein AAB655_02175 [Patescibacteria group bacterium]
MSTSQGKRELLSAVLRVAVLIVPQLFFIGGASAQGINISDVSEIRTNILCRIANTMFWILITLSVIMVLWGAFMYMTSSGDEKKVGDATKTITYAAVGVVVALMAKGFPALIASIFGIDSLRSC